MPDGRTEAAERNAAATTAWSARPQDQRLAYVQSLARSRHFYDVTWLLLTICALVVTVTTAKLAGRRPWDAAHVRARSRAADARHHQLGPDRRRPGRAGDAGVGPLATRCSPVRCWASRPRPSSTRCCSWCRCCCCACGPAAARAWLATAAMTVGVAVAVTAPVYLTAPSFAEQNGQQVKVLSSPLSRLGDEGLSALRAAPARSTALRGDQRGLPLLRPQQDARRRLGLALPAAAAAAHL